jgi:hypothetical protein
MRSLRHIGICGLLGMTLTASAACAATHTYPIALIDNRVFVDVRVDGAGPFAFIVDTGSSDTTIDDTLMKRLKLKPAGGGQTSGAGEQTVGYETVHLKSLTLGDLDLGAMDATSLDGRSLAAIIGFQKFDGVLGDELFAHHVVSIDAGKSQMTVEDSAGFAPGPTSIRVPMALNSDQTPVIDAAIDGVAGRYIVDTGDRSSLTMFGPYWRAQGLDKQIGQAVTAMTGYGIGGPIHGIVGRPAAFSLGGVDVPPPVTRLSLQKSGAFANSDYAGSIGMGILRRFVVSFDYAHNAMWLTKTADFDVPDLYDRFGAWLALGHGGDLTVIDVVDHGPAAEAGLRRGDDVTAIDGIQASWNAIFQLRALLKQPDKTQVTVSVVRDGKPMALTAALHDLISPPGSS